MDNGDGLPSKKRKIADDVAVANSAAGINVLVLPNGTSPSNKLIKELILLVKPKMKQLVNDANLVRFSNCSCKCSNSVVVHF